MPLIFIRCMASGCQRAALLRGGQDIRGALIGLGVLRIPWNERTHYDGGNTHEADSTYFLAFPLIFLHSATMPEENSFIFPAYRLLPTHIVERGEPMLFTFTCFSGGDTIKHHTADDYGADKTATRKNRNCRHDTGVFAISGVSVLNGVDLIGDLIPMRSDQAGSKCHVSVFGPMNSLQHRGRSRASCCIEKSP